MHTIIYFEMLAGSKIGTLFYALTPRNLHANFEESIMYFW